MTSKTKVLIIMPAYNASKTICRAIESVIHQTYPNWKLVVTDDGSNDSTGEIIWNYVESDRRINLISLSKNTGLPSVARNKGIQSIGSEYVAFLDADDEWLPSKLDVQLKVAKRHPEFAFICTKFYIRGQQKFLPNTFEMKSHEKRFYRSKLIFIGNQICTSTVFVRSKLLELHGGFNEDRVLRAREDYELWLRLSKFGSIWLVNEPLAVYQQGSHSAARPLDLKLAPLENVFRTFERNGAVSRLERLVMTTRHKLLQSLR